MVEKIVSLCKRRGFSFQSSEIYGGINGFWDHGPLGTELGSWNVGWPVRCIAIHPRQPHRVVAALTSGTLALLDTRVRGQ